MHPKFSHMILLLRFLSSNYRFLNLRKIQAKEERRDFHQAKDQVYNQNLVQTSKQVQNSDVISFDEDSIVKGAVKYNSNLSHMLMNQLKQAKVITGKREK